MSVVSLPDLLAGAVRDRYAVGYFESWDVYSLEATIAAAEAEQSPVIIGVGGLSGNHDWLRERGIDIYGGVSRRLAERADVPCAVLFNEADSFAEAAGALGAGYNAVMMHTQGWPKERLLADTATLTRAAHALGIAVEGEVGALAEMGPGGEINDGVAAMTTVDEAAEFVRGTEVDCLAVAIGNVHFVTSDYQPTLDLGRLAELAAAVDVPLVLHGGSGVSADQLHAAIAAGIAKVNFGTRLKDVFATELRAQLGSSNTDPNLVIGSRHEQDICLAAARALTIQIRELMVALGSSGRGRRR
ncbi:MAG: class II fructose-bisphosphate aldolase [Sciscionella sp.]